VQRARAGGEQPGHHHRVAGGVGRARVRASAARLRISAAVRASVALGGHLVEDLRDPRLDLGDGVQLLDAADRDGLAAAAAPPWRVSSIPAPCPPGPGRKHLGGNGNRRRSRLALPAALPAVATR
jgi:hypothetical protein